MKRCLRVVVLALMASSGLMAAAYAEDYTACYNAAVASSGVSAATFAAIQMTESGTTVSTCTSAVNQTVIGANKTSTDYSCMQINDSNLASLTSNYNSVHGTSLSTSEYFTQLTTNPCTAYEAAAFMLTHSSNCTSSSSQADLICAYNLGSCPPYSDAESQAACNTYLAKVLSAGATGGASTTTTTTSEKTFDASSCASPTSNLKEMKDSFVAALEKSAMESAARAADITATVRQTDIKKSYCIGNELKLIDWAAMKSMILNLIYQIIMDMVNQVLDYVCTEMQVMVNNVLTKLCVPMPTFGRINLGLSTSAMDACNGTALLTLGTSTGTTVVPLSSLATPITTYFNTLK